MTRPAELESRRLSSSAGRVIVSRSSGAFDASHAGLYHPYHQNLRRRHGGSGTLQLSPLRVPGTDLKVGTECKGHGEVIPSRWCHELHAIHTN